MGRLEELEFLERSGWYEHWGFPWGHYRALFDLLRRRRTPLRGVNAEKATRAAVRKGDVSGLASALREEIGPLAASPEAHGAYLLDVLRASGHGAGLAPDTPAFQAYRRVQVLWERLIGLRAARLAERSAERGIVVVLIGSGHLAYGLGANLQAARAGALAQLSIWDDVVAKSSGQRRYPVPVGMADLVRIYERDPAARNYPSLLGLQLEREAEGLRVKAIRVPEGSPLRALRAGDTILTLDGKPVSTPTALRLAYERLPPDGTAKLGLRRAGCELTVELRLAPPRN